MKKRIIKIIGAALAAALCLTVLFAELTADINMRYMPDYEKADITYLLDGRELTADDYRVLFYQTGLGKRAVDELKAGGRADTLLSFQNDFFAGSEVRCVREVITTCMEYTVDEDGLATAGFSLAPYKPGYVFLMLSSHTLGWRHGHAGIVTGADSVLESPMIGTLSCDFSPNEWRSYPTFVMLRLKDADDAFLAKTAKNAEKKLSGIRYNIFAGFFKKTHGSVPPTTHCAHLVWYAFYNSGLDVDRNGGNIVSVTDIMYSDKFEVVQIFGMNPDDFCDRAY